jgi:hypothetical protein
MHIFSLENTPFRRKDKSGLTLTSPCLRHEYLMMPYWHVSVYFAESNLLLSLEVKILAGESSCRRVASDLSAVFSLLRPWPQL